MTGARPVTPGKTRSCPHCKAVILESASVCPGCHHHLRFDSEAAQRQVAARSALRVEGKLEHPAHEDPWEYCVVIAMRNERGEEVARHVVNVGVLQGSEQRTFTLSVDVMPPRRPAATRQPTHVQTQGVVKQPQPALKPPGASPPGVTPRGLRPPGMKPPGPFKRS